MDECLARVEALSKSERKEFMHKLINKFPNAFAGKFQTCDSCGKLVPPSAITEDCQGYDNYTENCCEDCVTHCLCGEDYAPSGEYHHTDCKYEYALCFCGKVHSKSSRSACSVHVEYIQGPTINGQSGMRVKIDQNKQPFQISVCMSPKDAVTKATEILRAAGQDLDSITIDENIPRETIAVMYLHGADQNPKDGAEIDFDSVSIEWNEFDGSQAQPTLTFLGPSSNASEDVRSESQCDQSNQSASEACTASTANSGNKKRQREEL